MNESHVVHAADDNTATARAAAAAGTWSFHTAVSRRDCHFELRFCTPSENRSQHGSRPRQRRRLGLRRLTQHGDDHHSIRVYCRVVVLVIHSFRPILVGQKNTMPTASQLDRYGILPLSVKPSFSKCQCVSTSTVQVVTSGMRHFLSWLYVYCIPISLPSFSRAGLMPHLSLHLLRHYPIRQRTGGMHVSLGTVIWYHRPVWHSSRMNIILWPMRRMMILQVRLVLLLLFHRHFSCQGPVVQTRRPFWNTNFTPFGTSSTWLTSMKATATRTTAPHAHNLETIIISCTYCVSFDGPIHPFTPFRYSWSEEYNCQQDFATRSMRNLAFFFRQPSSSPNASTSMHRRDNSYNTCRGIFPVVVEGQQPLSRLSLVAAAACPTTN
jgi:hypothetical protein